MMMDSDDDEFIGGGGAKKQRVVPQVDTNTGTTGAPVLIDDAPAFETMSDGEAMDGVPMEAASTASEDTEQMDVEAPAPAQYDYTDTAPGENFVLTNRMSWRDYQFLKSLKLQDIKDLRPCEKGWTKAHQEELYKLLLKVLKQQKKVVGDVVEVTESYAPPKSGMSGRMYCSNGVQGLMGALAWRAMSTTAEADMKKAAPRGIKWWCRNPAPGSAVVDCPRLEEYIANDKRILSVTAREQGCTEEKAKQLFNSALFSDQPLKHIKASAPGVPSFLQKFDAEAKKIQAALIQRQELQWAKKFAKEPGNNQPGSFLSHVFQFTESRCALAAIKLFKARGDHVHCLKHDGIHIDAALFGNQELLDQLHGACESVFPGINMRWDFKKPDFWVKTKASRKKLRELVIPDDFETPPPPDEIVLLPFQSELLDRFASNADDRTITWVHTAQGKLGKNVMLVKLEEKYENDHVILYIDGEDNTAVKHLLMEHQQQLESATKSPIMIVNVARMGKANGNLLNIMETVKDGRFHSTKYGGGNLKIKVPPHILVTANVPPPLHGMSPDRWRIFTVDPADMTLLKDEVMHELMDKEEERLEQVQYDMVARIRAMTREDNEQAIFEQHYVLTGTPDPETKLSHADLYGTLVEEGGYTKNSVQLGKWMKEHYLKLALQEKRVVRGRSSTGVFWLGIEKKAKA